jgi:hypothetical protein
MGGKKKPKEEKENREGRGGKKKPKEEKKTEKRGGEEGGLPPPLRRWRGGELRRRWEGEI